MIIRQVVNSIFRSCSYIVSRDQQSWLIDCGDVDQILPLIGGSLCGVMLTHAHFDHIYGLNTLLSLFPSMPVYTSKAGLGGLLDDKMNFSRYYGDPIVLEKPGNVRTVNDGTTIELFNGIQAKAVFTPGHSPCCVTWIIGDAVFTGDSYIPGVKTVANIPHSDKHMAAQSEAAIRQLAEHRAIYPGHAPAMETMNEIFNI